MAEKVARLNKEQWDTLKAVLDGEIADLRAELQQAQEDKRRQQDYISELIDGSGKAWNDKRRYKVERDAAIERGKQLLRYSRNQEISLGNFVQKLYDMERRAKAAEARYPSWLPQAEEEGDK